MKGGFLNLVSVGPGYRELIAPQAADALRESDVIVGYDLYLQWIAPWIEGKRIHTLPLTQERERARLAIEHAREGQRVALVSSGDIGVYAMAALAFELMDENDTFGLRVTPGITAANACASLLGSPLSHDFATLSLSDLLCPWQWIEHRASHIAQADLAVVLYNVQSRQRPDGVHKILRLMLEHKRPDTWCGVVRNAYRPDQQVDIVELGALPERQFDMLTTIVIGNRFTQRKRQWIYTPRGYGDWDQSRTLAPPEPVPDANLRTLGEEDTVSGADLPLDAIWVFSGTRDGNELARLLVASGQRVIVSVASQYGEDLVVRDVPGAAVITGRLGIERRRELLRACRARSVVDATHPHASEMTRQLTRLANELGIDYIRYERPDSTCDAPVQQCDDVQSAAHLAVELGSRIFLATGVTQLDSFLRHPGAAHRDWYLRLTPDPAQLQRALAAGIQRDHVIAMQGPFSQAFNEALWRDLEIDCVVSKESGEAGGYSAKASAARALGIPFIAIRRPALDHPNVVRDFAAVLSHLKGTPAP
ncbi:precorrin-3B C(17)-methyltransferase [Pararobbsia alpina]|uniref:Siroheme synthase n=1 Tax=Pararobbsia alpina TaxID=621374 RepID=A0A6S7CLK7_9BURK|nr:precorrin-3B C(17)-methyltransferase [Pararobbsia alpina]CAB3792796.1 Siroheme synthase [Pararobbsia alpina]